MYIYGGYILTGGKFNSGENMGKSWRGIRIMLADVDVPDELPATAEAAKGAPRLVDQLQKQCQTLSIGQLCEIVCNLQGRITSIKPIGKHP